MLQARSDPRASGLPALQLLEPTAVGDAPGRDATVPGTAAAPSPAGDAREAAVARYRAIRDASVALAAGLSEADVTVQSMPDASPVKWHLAHTTWFFETFVLETTEPGFAPHHPAYRMLFNSYYEAVGERHPRPERGMLTRPSLAEVLEYRRAVDARMAALLAQGALADGRVAALVELGLHHEQQHQELILTDLKHLLSRNPLRPAYREEGAAWSPALRQPHWIRYPGGLHRIGHDGAGFAFDNEGPRHSVYLPPFELAAWPVSNGEYLEFVEDGGYRRPELWMSLGWDAVRAHGWQAPAYWERAHEAARGAQGWRVYTLHGMADLEPDAPVCHVSWFEADAYARWREARLPLEAEWEIAASAALEAMESAHLAPEAPLHPSPARAPRHPDLPAQLFGDVWEWTGSPYVPYPGFRPAPGAVGEYNGKFMCNQYVLRGGSCATPPGHVRATYRNFFPPEARWQFSGIRLARDC